MRFRINWKKTVLVVTDILLLGYLVTAMVSFNNPDNSDRKCSKVSIHIADENTNGFLNAQEVKNILERNRLYPIGKPSETVNPRNIEDHLMKSPFVNTAQCYKTQNGHVCITITQRLPIIRVKNNLATTTILMSGEESCRTRLLPPPDRRASPRLAHSDQRPHPACHRESCTRPAARPRSIRGLSAADSTASPPAAPFPQRERNAL